LLGEADVLVEELNYFLVQSGLLLTALEKPRDFVMSNQAVPITAAGLQGEQPLVDRIM
jgi:hypothetical protein